MSLLGNVGNVTSKFAGEVFEWKIPNFSSLTLNVSKSDYYDSPSFTFGGATFYLRLYPAGCKGSEDGDISLFLWLESSSPLLPFTVTYVFGIKNSIRNMYLTDAGSHTCRKPTGRGMWRFLKKSELTYNVAELLPDDILTIKCSLKHGDASELMLKANCTNVTGTSRIMSHLSTIECL